MGATAFLALLGAATLELEVPCLGDARSFLKCRQPLHLSSPQCHPPSPRPFAVQQPQEEHKEQDPHRRGAAAAFGAAGPPAGVRALRPQRERGHSICRHVWRHRQAGVGHAALLPACCTLDLSLAACSLYPASWTLDPGPCTVRVDRGPRLLSGVVPCRKLLEQPYPKSGSKVVQMGQGQFPPVNTIQSAIA